MSGDMLPSFERVTAPDGIRRVERDSPGSDSRNKKKEQGRDDKQPPHDPDADVPQDVVDLSEQFHPNASGQASPAKSDPSASGKPAGPGGSSSGGASSHPLDRHLDIQV
jgi:hypothetical protein